MSEEAATAELVRALYGSLAAREPKPDPGIDGLAELLHRYDDQFREFRMEPVEVVALGEKVFVKVRIGGIGLSGAEQWTTGYHVHTVTGGKLVGLEVFSERAEAARLAGLTEAS